MNSSKKVRVRFAPSPTGGLHLGGVRTALFNYLFAKKHNGSFILRIEDTDQSRFVPGAEQYIVDCLNWCGILPDESPNEGGPFGPYRQSERKSNYRQFAEQLIKDGHAYYAFDTPEELAKVREKEPNFKYSHENRLTLKNSLSLSQEEVSDLLNAGAPHTIRIKVPKNQIVTFEDLIRGTVSFETNLLDDKVLLKADGMPTYHLAVVVDDKAMEISHVFRGEEWLPSAPIHILLWKYLGWENEQPSWAHLPLILKPDGKGKLSKRDGIRLGFPVYAMNWTDPQTNELTQGYKETGFLPEAFVNLLALLGWNDGSEKEIFTIQELIESFSLDRIAKGGARFDYTKACWFNHQWLQTYPEDKLTTELRNVLIANGIDNKQIEEDKIQVIFHLIKDRMNLLTDFWDQGNFFFKQPLALDIDSVHKKWNEEKSLFFKEISQEFQNFQNDWNQEVISAFYKSKIKESGMKIGELMLPFRIALVGGKFGPDVFVIAEQLGKQEVVKRLDYFINEISK